VRHTMGAAYIAVSGLWWQDSTTNRTSLWPASISCRHSFKRQCVWDGSKEATVLSDRGGVGITPIAAALSSHTFELAGLREQAVRRLKAFALAYGAKSRHRSAQRTRLPQRKS